MTKSIRTTVIPAHCGWNPDNPPCVCVGLLSDGTVEITSNIRSAGVTIAITQGEFREMAVAADFAFAGLTLTPVGDDLFHLSSPDGATIVYDGGEIDRFWASIRVGDFDDILSANLVGA